MRNHLNSKTVAGLTVILLVSCGMAFLGKLTPDLVEVIKWVGASFMAVRAVSNHAEGRNADTRS